MGGEADRVARCARAAVRGLDFRRCGAQPEGPSIVERDDAELSRAGRLVIRRQGIPDEGQASPGPAQRRNPAERIRHHAAWLQR